MLGWPRWLPLAQALAAQVRGNRDGDGHSKKRAFSRTLEKTCRRCNIGRPVISQGTRSTGGWNQVQGRGTCCLPHTPHTLFGWWRGEGCPASGRCAGARSACEGKQGQGLRMLGNVHTLPHSPHTFQHITCLCPTYRCCWVGQDGAEDTSVL